MIWVIAWLPLAFLISWKINWRPTQPLTLQQKLPLLITLYLIAPIVLWGITVATGASFQSYGLVWQFQRLPAIAGGFLLGIAGLIVLFFSQNWLGWMNWQWQQIQQFQQSLLPGLILGLGVGLIEELIFRGFLLTQLQQIWSPWGAAAIASIIFSVLHLVWEGRQGLPQLPGLWLMGMVLVLARWTDGGNLSLAWGLHAGWICGMSAIDAAQLVTYRDRVPTWVTGLDQKPLAGLMGILFLLGTGVFLLLTIKFSEAGWGLAS